MGRILECRVGGWWRWQMAIAGKHGGIRLSRLLQPSAGARTRRVGCFFVAHKREQILNEKKKQKQKGKKKRRPTLRQMERVTPTDPQSHILQLLWQWQRLMASLLRCHGRFCSGNICSPPPLVPSLSSLSPPRRPSPTHSSTPLFLNVSFPCSTRSHRFTEHLTPCRCSSGPPDVHK